MCKEWYDAEQDRIWHIMHSILKGGVVLQKLQRNNWNTRKIVYHSMFLTNSKIILQNLMLYVKRHVLVECQESLGWTLIGWVFSCICQFPIFLNDSKTLIVLQSISHVSRFIWMHWMLFFALKLLCYPPNAARVILCHTNVSQWRFKIQFSEGDLNGTHLHI